MFSRLRTLAHQLYPRIRSAKISTVHNNNAACCSIPPVQSNYTPKGSFKPYGGFNKVRRSWSAPYLPTIYANAHTSIVSTRAGIPRRSM